MFKYSPFAVGLIIGFLMASYERYRRKTKNIKAKISLRAFYLLSAIAPQKWLVGGIEYEYGDFLPNDCPFWFCGKTKVDGTVLYSPRGKGIRCVDAEEFSVLGNRRNTDEDMSDCVLFRLSYFDYIRLRLDYRMYVWRRKRKWKQETSDEKVATEKAALKLAYTSILKDIEEYRKMAQCEFAEAVDLAESVVADSTGEPCVDMDRLREQMKTTNSVLH